MSSRSTVLIGAALALGLGAAQNLSGQNLSGQNLSVPNLSAQAAPLPNPAPAKPETTMTSTSPSPRPFTYLTLVKVPASAPSLTPVTVQLQTDGAATNPYDPAQVDLQLTLTAPGGKVFSVPAFYGYTVDDAGKAQGAPGWLARFTPVEVGVYSLTAKLKGGIGSGSVSLNVTQGSGPGFIGVSKENPRLFAYGNGDVYVPIGLNVAWTDQDVLGDYRRYFDNLSANGGNFARVWMPAWGLGLEWKDTGLGDYTARERQMALLDQVFRLAQVRGISIELCLINHGQFSQTVNAEWQGNPYNAANGGPLRAPGEFVTDARARDLFKRRLRYLAARFAAYPNLFAWEYWNEVNWTPIADSDLRPWIQEMTATLRTYDPYDHLVSTSYSGGAASATWTLPELGFAQQHLYTNRELPTELTGLIRQFRETVPNKPVLLAELGYSAGGSDAPLETERTHLHTGLWSPLFLGYAGSGMYWWWDTLVGPKNLWSEYRGLGIFLKGQPLAALRPVSVQTAQLDTEAHALRSRDHALVYLISDQYSAAAANHAYTEALLGGAAGKPNSPVWTQELPLRQTILSVRGLEDGRYHARWFDPQAAKWTGTVAISSVGGVLRVQTPRFGRDLAVVIERVGRR